MKIATLQETVTVQRESPLVETQKSDLRAASAPTQVREPAAQRPQLARSRGARARRPRQSRHDSRRVRRRRHGEIPGRWRRRQRPVLRRLEPGLQPGEHPGVRGHHQPLRRRVRPRGRRGDQRRHQVRHEPASRATGFGFLRDSDLGDAKNFFTNKVRDVPREADRSQRRRSDPARSRLLLRELRVPGTRRDRDSANRLRRRSTCRRSNDITRHYTTFRGDVQTGPEASRCSRGRRSTTGNSSMSASASATRSPNGYSRPSKNTDLSVGETWVVSDRMVNEIRAGFSAIDNKLVSNSTLPLHTFPSIIIGSPTNSPQWWTEFNSPDQRLAQLLRALVAWRAQSEDRLPVLPAGLQGRVSQRRSVGRLVHVLHAIRATPTIRAPIPRRRNYSVVLGDPSYAIKNATYGMFFKDDWSVSPRADAQSRVPVRPRVRDRQHRSAESDRAGREERRLQQRRAAPRIRLRPRAATAAPSSAAVTVATSTRCCSTSRATSAGRFCSSSRAYTVLNPSYTNPLNGLTFEDIKAQNLPRNMIVIANDYKTPTADQVSIGVAHQFGASYAVPDGLRPFARASTSRARAASTSSRIRRRTCRRIRESSAAAVPAVHQHHALRNDGELRLRRLAVRSPGTRHRPAVG